MTKTPLLTLAGALWMLTLAWNVPAYAVLPSEILADPVLEARAREISKGLRCLVCQNQSIDDSDAGLAKDLRVLVRDRLTVGDSNDQVVEFVVSRYGDFVLLRPPFMMSTLALWLGPVVIGGGGLLAVFLFFRRSRRVVTTGKPGTATAANRPAPLSDDEKRRLDALLGDDKT